MSVNVTPLHDRVLIKRIEEKESIKGGIIIPDTAKEKPQEGEVIAAGAGKIEKGERIPLDVKAGDRVLFGKYSGTEIKVDDEDYLILREEEILAKLVRRSQGCRRQEVTFPLIRRLTVSHRGEPRQAEGRNFEILKILKRRKTHGKANRDW